MQSLPTAVCDKAGGPLEELAWKEMLGILDHELGRLPDRYRGPLVLCYLEGRTQDEAARQLGWGLNTLRRRLAQGRQLLEARLRGRGVTLPAVLAGLLAASAVAVPAHLRAATLAAAGARAVESLDRRRRCPLLGEERVSPPPFHSGPEGRGPRRGGGPGERRLFRLLPAPPRRSSPGGEPPPPAAPAADAERGDLAADPLPAQGAVRLGTGRYRHGTRIESFAVSADGRLAVVAGGGPRGCST